MNQLRGAGVSFGINTDTRTITNITLREEYEKIHDHFGWQPEDFLRCNLDALEAAFAPRSLKEQLRAQLLAGYPHRDAQSHPRANPEQRQQEKSP